MQCELGYACPFTGMTAMSVPCAAGYYCPLGTQFTTQYACPSGTYSDATNLVKIGDWYDRRNYFTLQI